MARSTPLTTGIRSAPTTEMGTERGCRPHEVPGLVLVALTAARAVHDGPDPVRRGSDSLAGGQVAGDELDAVGGFVVPPTEHPDIATGFTQAWNDESPERTGAAGDQDG